MGIVALVLSAVCMRAGSVRAGGGPQNVAVVVNRNSWASQAVANAFIALRDIPANNVVYLDSIEQFERMDVEAFREKILTPVFATLKQRGLLDQIDCIAYSSDLPTAISVRADVGQRKLPKVLTQVGSINGLTYLHERVRAKDPDYLQLNTNRYMRRPVRRLRIKTMTVADRAAYAKVMEQMGKQQWKEASATLTELAKRYGGDPGLQYNCACCLARLGDSEAALRALDRAVRAGWADARHAKQDEDLATLRAVPRFAELLKAMDRAAHAPFEVQPTMAFRSQYAWDQLGRNTTGTGEHYMLSIVLAVTSGRGNSVSEAIRCLQRGRAADGTAPRGTIYYMLNSNIRSKTRQGGFESAIKALEKIGVRGEILKGTLPQGKDDVAGAMVGTATFHWSACGSTILPGAICEHLTSLGGVMREGGGQTPLSELIRYGATGASGTVTEPYALQAKFPFPFIHVHYARGCSLAEAFYQSVFGPYQLLIVGDPLCQPWARRCRVAIDGVKPETRVHGTITLHATAHGTDGPAAVDHFECFVDGKRYAVADTGSPLQLDTTKMVDGWHEVSVVAIAAGPIETQSRASLPIMVANHGDQVALALVGPAEARWGDVVTLRASAPHANAIAVLHNARRVGLVTQESGQVEIPAAVLGLGKVSLQAVAQIGDRFALSKPLTVAVQMPPPLRPKTAPDKSKLADGFRVEPEGGKPMIVTDVHASQWLKNAGVTPRQRFTVRGWIAVPNNDIYQFQFRGSGVTRLIVDRQPVWTGSKLGGSSATWQMVPVNLAGGLHEVRFDGIGGKSPRLEMRFGGPGCLRLDGKRLRHEF